MALEVKKIIDEMNEMRNNVFPKFRDTIGKRMDNVLSYVNNPFTIRYEKFQAKLKEVLEEFDKNKEIEKLELENFLLEAFNKKCMKELNLEHYYTLMKQHDQHNKKALANYPKVIAREKALSDKAKQIREKNKRYPLSPFMQNLQDLAFYLKTQQPKEIKINRISPYGYGY